LPVARQPPRRRSGQPAYREVALGRGLPLTKRFTKPLVLGELVQYRPNIRQAAKQDLQRYPPFKPDSVGFLIDDLADVFRYRGKVENLFVIVGCPALGRAKRNGGNRPGIDRAVIRQRSP
jgi:hypothetical protein